MSANSVSWARFCNFFFWTDCYSEWFQRPWRQWVLLKQRPAVLGNISGACALGKISAFFMVPPHPNCGDIISGKKIHVGYSLPTTELKWFLTAIFWIINSSYSVKTFMQSTCVVIMIVMGVSESRDGILIVAWFYLFLQKHIINTI